jgi:hypothetical protein
VVSRDAFLGADPREVFMEMGEINLRIVVDAQRTNLRWLAGVQSWNPETDVGKLAEMLEAVIVEWDVEDFPPTAENISLLSPHQAANLAEAIMRGIAPSSEEGNGSSLPSSASATAEESSGEVSQSSLNGSPTIDSQTVSASPSGT